MVLKTDQPLKQARGNLCMPIVLVSAVFEGVSNVMTAAWCSPSSFDPLLINVSVGLTRYTHDLIMKSGFFALNILAEDQLDLAVACGNISGREVDKFKEYNISTRPGQKTPAPLVNGCSANIECSLHGYFKTGDHTVFVGETLRYDEDPDKSPLIRVRGDFFKVGDNLGKDEHPAKV